jgi:hypothetical protein
MNRASHICPSCLCNKRCSYSDDYHEACDDYKPIAEPLYVCEAAGRCTAYCGSKNPHKFLFGCCDKPCNDCRAEILYGGNGARCKPTTTEETMDEKLLTFKEVCECVVKGEAIEFKSRGNHGNWITFDDETIDCDDLIYRRKPAKVVKPWTLDTCPREGWIRPKLDKLMAMRITYVSDLCAGSAGNSPPYKRLFDDYEYSPNGMGGWTHCGTEVAE